MSAKDFKNNGLASALQDKTTINSKANANNNTKGNSKINKKGTNKTQINKNRKLSTQDFLKYIDRKDMKKNNYAEIIQLNDLKDYFQKLAKVESNIDGNINEQLFDKTLAKDIDQPLYPTRRISFQLPPYLHRAIVMAVETLKANNDQEFINKIESDLGIDDELYGGIIYITQASLIAAILLGSIELSERTQAAILENLDAEFNGIGTLIENGNLTVQTTTQKKHAFPVMVSPYILKCYEYSLKDKLSKIFSADAMNKLGKELDDESLQTYSLLNDGVISKLVEAQKPNVTIDNKIHEALFGKLIKK